MKMPARLTNAKHESLFKAIGDLLSYCRDRDWSGYDPYDGLNSKIFQATPLRRSAVARLVQVQVMKRSPINLRPLLRVPKTENPKGLALFASAAFRLSHMGIVEQSLGFSLVDRLMQLRSPGFHSLCWGYPFDWQNRHFMLPRHHPNIICSTFGGHALVDAYENSGDEKYLHGASRVTDFILRELKRSVVGNSFCFSYTTLDRGQVHNANLLGAAFLARVWRHTQADVLRDEAVRAAHFTVARQRADGSWAYGEARNQQWVDGFHTGYNLVALHGLNRTFDLPWLKFSLDRGYEFYRKHFFASDGVAKYFHDRIYPLDIHSTAQGIITLVELADHDPMAVPLATTLLEWANRKMCSKEGFFYFQKHRWWTVRIPYMRWSQAWMLLAMARLAEAVIADTSSDSAIQGSHYLEPIQRN